MGSINTTTFQELIDDSTPPPVAPAAHRTLSSSLDPRSPPPSQMVTRTPIQVFKTPDTIDDPRSPPASDAITRTPIQVPLAASALGDPRSPLGDPRSPSERLARTPLPEPRTGDVLVDPRSPTVGIVRTPIHGAETVTAVGEEVRVYAAATEERPQPADSDQTRTSDPQPHLVKQLIKLAVTPPVPRDVKSSRPKTLFVACGEGDKPPAPPRSPLGRHNGGAADTPRALVQRRQVVKLGLRPTGRRSESHRSCGDSDKENVASPLARR